MKKIVNSLCSLVALFLVSASLVSCADNVIDEPTNSDGKYTMTVTATKDAPTKALATAGSTLTASWSKNDAVQVYMGGALIGTLYAQSAGATTQLKGDITTPTPLSQGNILTLKYLSPNYATQDGTLTGFATSIDRVCDYAEASSVTVTSVSNEEIRTEAATFVNKQAIVKFTLKNNSNVAISATALTVSATNPILDANNRYTVTYSYTVTPAPAASEIYVALPGISGQTLNLTATVGTDTYVYQKSGITFTNGQYYEIAVKMPKLYPASSITVLRGQTGYRNAPDEGIDKLLDGNKSTKWCSLEYGPATYPIRVSQYQNGVKDQVIWKTASSIVLTNYILTTGGDTDNNHLRNWKSWTIYGANFDSDSEATINASGWTLIQQITNDNVLQLVHCADFWYAIPNNDTAYKYYRLVIDETINNANNQMSNEHQMSEMTLFTK